MPLVPDITVIIPTRRRPESLRETLRCLATTGHEGLLIDVIVVENDTELKCKEIALSFLPLLSMRHLQETLPGKAHCINRALDEKLLGKIVVWLDDDMSPLGDWFHEIANTCERNPDHDLFGGRIWPKYPTPNPPSWSEHYLIRQMMHSSIDLGPKDIELAKSHFPSPNHVWFRRCVFDSNTRIHDLPCF